MDVRRGGGGGHLYITQDGYLLFLQSYISKWIGRRGRAKGGARLPACSPMVACLYKLRPMIYAFRTSDKALLYLSSFAPVPPFLSLIHI